MKFSTLVIAMLIIGNVVWCSYLAHEDRRLNYIALEHTQIKIIDNQKEIIKMIKAAHPHHKKIRMHMITK